MKRLQIIILCKVILYMVVFRLSCLTLIPLAYQFFPEWTWNIFYGTVGSLIAILVTFTFLKFEKRNLSAIGLTWCSLTVFRFFIGLIIGLILFSLMVVTLLTLTSLEVHAQEAPNLVNAIGLSFMIFLGLALMEEIVYRSYPLLLLKSQFSLRTGIYITSVAFALYHGVAYESFLGPGVWGLLYGLMAIWSKGIAMPTGFHFGLNWFQGFLGMKEYRTESIWHFVDGDGPSLFTVEQVGTGIQIILFVFGMLMIEWYIRRKRVL